MNNQTTVWGLILLALIAANLPFFTNRLFMVVTLKMTVKPVAYRLLEVIGYYLLVGLVGYALEVKSNGQAHVQDWEFYVVTFFIFLVMAMPGFIYRYNFSKQVTKLAAKQKAV